MHLQHLGGNANNCEACDIDKVMGIFIESLKLEKTLNFVNKLLGLMFYSFYFTVKIELALMTKYFFSKVRFSRMCCYPYDLASYCIQHCS